MTLSDAFEKAQALLDQRPLPADTDAQLRALERQAPDDEAELWGDLWEAYYAAGGEDDTE